MKLVPVTTPEDVEWLREQRNNPAMYKYFRQDRPITPEEQSKWWKNLDHRKVRLYLMIEQGKRIGYCGFNPINLYASSAEFGIFVIPERQGDGYAELGMRYLLDIGFNSMHLATIYSDCLDYPGENRFGFYARMGFIAHPQECQTVRYKKQGAWVPSIKFYMTKDMYTERNGQKVDGGMATGPAAPVIAKNEAGKGKNPRVHPGKNRVKAAA